MNKTETKFKETELGEIPEDWEVKELGDCFEVNTGKGVPVSKRLSKGKYCLMGGNGIIGYTEDFLVNGDYILTGRVGTIGKVIFKSGKFWISDNAMYIGSKGKNNIKFIYYFLKKADFTFLNVGSTQPLIKQSDLKKMNIPFPKDTEQFSIAKILSDLDAKVELNQEMNKTLEAIGKAIFKRWFIDFEFPNEKGEPYKSSGGEMVDSELGEIPKGWQVGKLKDFIFVERGLSYKGSGLSEEGIPMINLGNIAPNNHFRYEGLKYYSGEYKERNLVKPGDLVIANTDITQNREVLGSCLVVPDDLGSDKVIFTHHIYAVRHKNSTLSNHFISFLLQIPEYRERASGFATGTTVLALPEDAILDFNFVLPTENLMKKYDTMLTYIKNKAAENIKESKNLSTIRDSLLPKLMSGKIRVPVEVR